MRGDSRRMEEGVSLEALCLFDRNGRHAMVKRVFTRVCFCIDTTVHIML